MDTLLLVKAAIMGIVEGLTEFLPISSTGHLILAGSLMGFVGGKAKVFEIAIQTGAIFAVILVYWQRIRDTVVALPTSAQARRFGAMIEAAEEFSFLAPVRLNVVCFTLAGAPDAATIAAFLARLRDDGRVFLTPTVLHGTPAIRAAFSNWRTTDADLEIAFGALMACR